MLAQHRFLDDSLHIHRINFNKLSGAACQSVITGVNTDPSSFQPHYLGIRFQDIIRKFLPKYNL